MLGQERLSEVRNPAGERKYVRKRVLRCVCAWSLWSSSDFRTWNLVSEKRSVRSQWECGWGTDGAGPLNFILGVVGSHEGFESVQFSSVAQSCPTLCDPMDCSTPGLPVHHQHLEFAQTHVLWVSDTIQPSHPLSSLSPPAFNLSQHQGLFQWVSSSHQVAKILEFQLQHQSFQWIFRTDFL